MPGGFTAGDPSDPDVNAAAAFAIASRASATGQRVSLKRVARAERQIVSGMNFRLCLEVDAGGTVQYVLAVVYRDLQQTLRLTQWAPGGCGGES